MYVYIYVYIYISQPPRSQIVLEDDAEELRLVNLEDVTFAARGDGQGRDLSLTVLRIQVCVCV